MSYETTISQWAATARSAVLADVKAITRDAHANIVLVTPIDTGRAKSSWNVAAGFNPDLSVTPLLEDRRNLVTGAVIEKAVAGAQPLTRGQAITAGLGRGQVLDRLTEPVATISNNLPYINSLERGASKQAEAGQMFGANVFNALDEAERLGYVGRLT